MENGIDPRIIHLGRRAIAAGRRLLLAGFGPRDLGEYEGIKSSPFEFWPASDYRNVVRPVPQDVMLVLMGKLRRHGLTERIQRSKPSDAVVYTRPFSPGELKTFLREVYPLPQAKTSSPSMDTTVNSPSASSASVPTVPRIPANVSYAVPGVHGPARMASPVLAAASPVPELTNATVSPPAPAAPQEAIQMKKGEGIAFVRQHVNVNAPKPSEEINRLVVLAAERGLDLRHTTATNAFYAVKKERQTADGSSELAAESTTATVPTLTPIVKANGVRRGDTTKQLIEFCHGAELAGVIVLEIIEENKRLHAEVDALKAELKGKKAAIKRALANI